VNPARPHAVVFDLGKVLVDFDYGIAARKIAAKGKWMHDEVKRFIAESPLLFRYETGLISKEDFYAQVCKTTGYCGDLEEFGGHFSDIFTPIEPMVALQTELRKKGTPTYIFSNTNDLAIHHIRRNFPFFGNFDGYVLSYEQGAMKPDEKIYAVVEQMSGKGGPEILYLDDRLENVEAGARRGWQVILQESPDKTRALVTALGLLQSQ
jgi:HAD superfamily hydrolase (TIGR01509 family)